MAVAPLFVASMAALKASLQLTNATQADTLAVIDRVVSEVRVGFYDKLGSSLVSRIVGYSVTENPTSTNEILRLKASNIETCWVKMRLLEELPVLFMDASNSVSQEWNEEGLTRNAASREIRKLIDSLRTKVNRGLGDLAGGGANISVIGPEDTPPRPGETIFPPPSTVETV